LEDQPALPIQRQGGASPAVADGAEDRAMSAPRTLGQASVDQPVAVYDRRLATNLDEQRVVIVQPAAKLVGDRLARQPRVVDLGAQAGDAAERSVSAPLGLGSRAVRRPSSGGRRGR
jgi:hypothetical protein